MGEDVKQRVCEGVCLRKEEMCEGGKSLLEGAMCVTGSKRKEKKKSGDGWEMIPPEKGEGVKESDTEGKGRKKNNRETIKGLGEKRGRDSRESCKCVLKTERRK